MKAPADLPLVSAFVLAGGASSRMGTDKALLRVGGIPMIERALYLLRSLGLAPRIVGTRVDLERYAPTIPDRHEKCGPLSGIEAGLLASTSEFALFIPVDVPLLPATLLKLLLHRAAINHAPANIPRILGQPQPLVAVYRRELLPAISLGLTSGDYKVMRVMHQGASALARNLDIFDVENVVTASGDDTGWPKLLADGLLNCNTLNDVTRLAPMMTQSQMGQASPTLKQDLNQ